jgi:hypothetical protein
MDHLIEAPSAFLAKPERKKQVATALALLRDAWDAAQDVQRSPWQFAVKIEEFRAAGIADAFLLWLVAQGYVDHSSGTAETACLDVRRGLDIREDTRFVLSKSGLAFGAEWFAGKRAHPARNKGTKGSPLGGHIRPCWDAQLQRLYWNGVLVKQYRVPAANQQLILAAFEEERWPPRIDDPLPQSGGIDPIARLHDAIKRLNRNQISQLLVFGGDGSGRGVMWRPVA